MSECPQNSASCSTVGVCFTASVPRARSRHAAALSPAASVRALPLATQAPTNARPQRCTRASVGKRPRRSTAVSATAGGISGTSSASATDSLPSLFRTASPSPSATIRDLNKPRSQPASAASADFMTWRKRGTRTSTFLNRSLTGWHRRLAIIIASAAALFTPAPPSCRSAEDHLWKRACCNADKISRSHASLKLGTSWLTSCVTKRQAAAAEEASRDLPVPA
mmetsp:Transcript_8983/g.23425  ORF Transcript_8983/g.23425 Transcript_8983/m.23425 type:complete len:223 (-) Transcript_8983:1359-2027(-)